MNLPAHECNCVEVCNLQEWSGGNFVICPLNCNDSCEPQVQLQCRTCNERQVWMQTHEGKCHGASYLQQSMEVLPRDPTAIPKPDCNDDHNKLWVNHDVDDHGTAQLDCNDMHQWLLKNAKLRFETNLTIKLFVGFWCPMQDKKHVCTNLNDKKTCSIFFQPGSLT